MAKAGLLHFDLQKMEQHNCSEAACSETGPLLIDNDRPASEDLHAVGAAVLEHHSAINDGTTTLDGHSSDLLSNERSCCPTTSSVALQPNATEYLKSTPRQKSIKPATSSPFFDNGSSTVEVQTPPKKPRTALPKTPLRSSYFSQPSSTTTSPYRQSQARTEEAFSPNNENEPRSILETVETACSENAICSRDLAPIVQEASSNAVASPNGHRKVEGRTDTRTTELGKVHTTIPKPSNLTESTMSVPEPLTPRITRSQTRRENLTAKPNQELHQRMENETPRQARKDENSTESSSSLSDSQSSTNSFKTARSDSEVESDDDSLSSLEIKPTPQTRTRKSIGPKISSHFPTTSSPKPRKKIAGRVSALPFPPLDVGRFGLIQEELVHESFWLIIATIFLTLTTGKKAIPVFRAVRERWPTPQQLRHAEYDQLFEMMRELGLWKRVARILELAGAWCDVPPELGCRYRVLHYPERGDGRDIRVGEVLDDGDMRAGAWEIGHIVKGAYALDSWRIFCRDVCRGLAEGWKGEGSVHGGHVVTEEAAAAAEDGNREEKEKTNSGFEPEWKRVVPNDKELRAILRWMWLKEGWYFDVESGQRWVAGEVLMRAAVEGRVTWDGSSGDLMVADVGALSEEEENKDELEMSDTCKEIMKRWRELVRRTRDEMGPHLDEQKRQESR